MPGKGSMGSRGGAETRTSKACPSRADQPAFIEVLAILTGTMGPACVSAVALLYQLFQMTVSSVPDAGPAITIAK
jgi:hypothetical protein